MKIGTSTKVAISVIGVIVSGFIGFNVVRYYEIRQPEIKLSEKFTQQKTRPTSKSESIQQSSNNSEKTALAKQYTKKEIEEALTWLDSLEKDKVTRSDFQRP